jgi:hypothetical protein
MTIRRVRRIIRKVDPWTVLKAGFVVNLVAGLIWTLGVWVAWSIAIQRGIPDDVADILGRLTIAFTPDGDLYFRVVLMFVIVWVIGATATLTLLAVLYNLVSDVVGGIELVMLEESVDPVIPERPRPVIHVPTSTNGSSIGADDTVEHTSAS